MLKVNPRQETYAKAKTWMVPLIVVAALAGGVAIAAYRVVAPQPPQPGYSQIRPVKTTPDAKLAVDQEEAELGVLAIVDVGRAEFRLKNTGSEPVEISQIRTSCMCTFAEIAMPVGKSPEFNMAMHNDAATNGWQGVLEASEEAIVTVIYKPSLMPVEGSVARYVKFATTDPQNPNIELGIHAIVKGGAAG